MKHQPTSDTAADRAEEPMSGGVTAVLQSMLRNTEERENRFARALRDQVARLDESDANDDSDAVAGTHEPLERESRADDPDQERPGIGDPGTHHTAAPLEVPDVADRTPIITPEGVTQSVGPAHEDAPARDIGQRTGMRTPQVGSGTTFIDLAEPAPLDRAPAHGDPGSDHHLAEAPQPAPAQAFVSDPPAAPARFAPALKLPEERTDVVFGDFADMGRPRWNRDRLVDLAMPRELLEAVAGLDPHADLKWMEVLVRAAAEPCAQVPEASAMLISGSHTRLADVLGLPIHRPGDLPPYGGSIYCLLPPAPAPGDIQWLRRVQGDRGTHVILEDERSQDLITDDVTTVSYASELGAALALKWSLTAGLSLAFGVTHAGEPIRATPFDVALAVRTWMRSG